jgi:hypothetical protein
MGQYYKAILLKELKDGKTKEEIKTWFNSWDYECGLKLMEHSWMKNPFVKAVETKLSEEPQRVVWAGDYADEEEDSVFINSEGEEEKYTLYTLASDETKLGDKVKPKHFRYVVNHTKKTFVDKNKVPKDNDGWRIHPLPLLTVEGNNRGGGDFRGESPLIGIWARDLISVSTKKPKEYSEIIFDLTEEPFFI